MSHSASSNKPPLGGLLRNLSSDLTLLVGRELRLYKGVQELRDLLLLGMKTCWSYSNGTLTSESLFQTDCIQTSHPNIYPPISMPSYKGT